LVISHFQTYIEDKIVAQYPHELITYGGNGSVFNNWAQYLVTMKYLSEMEEDQTLDLYSGLLDIILNIKDILWDYFQVIIILQEL
jgi:urocanate hydratase